MDFIFMLTRNDRTIADCLDVLRRIRPLGLRHVGFKDVGADPETLRRLTDAIHASGAVSYLEAVADDPQASLAAARSARDLGVMRLLGGTRVAEIQDVLRGSATQYYPFAGKPSGHPTELGGQPQDVELDCRAFAAAGCAGCDLLAYRATEADPHDLIRAARRGLGPQRHLIVAGAITSSGQIEAVHEAGADAFTIGTAVLDGAYAAGDPSLNAQLSQVMADCARVCAG
jgi:hypothetical protein